MTGVVKFDQCPKLKRVVNEFIHLDITDQSLLMIGEIPLLWYFYCYEAGDYLDWKSRWSRDGISRLFMDLEDNVINIIRKDLSNLVHSLTLSQTTILLFTFQESASQNLWKSPEKLTRVRIRRSCLICRERATRRRRPEPQLWCCLWMRTTSVASSKWDTEGGYIFPTRLWPSGVQCM